MEVQLVEDLARTMKYALQARLGQRAGNELAVMQWLRLHAANALNKYHVHSNNGRAADQYLHGRSCQEELADVNKIFYNIHSKVETNMDPRLLPGVYLGRALSADEAYVGTPGGGVIRARVINRMHGEKTWDNELIVNLRGTPGDMKARHADGIDRDHIE